jgi:hypothetical protein
MHRPQPTSSRVRLCLINHDASLSINQCSRCEHGLRGPPVNTTRRQPAVIPTGHPSHSDPPSQVRLCLTKDDASLSTYQSWPQSRHPVVDPKRGITRQQPKPEQAYPGAPDTQPSRKWLNLSDSNLSTSRAYRLTSAQTRSDKQRAQCTIQRLTTYDTQSGVAKGILPGCNLRSNCRCSCPAVRMTTRILLRPSSTHEPSDPPRRVHNQTFHTPLPSQGATKANEQCHNTVSANWLAGPTRPVSRLHHSCPRRAKT